ncbi:hypothetical protein A1A1_08139 [Planococcus antarcticus DSM 14505]|uniref:Uncharacterized protein n=1 Tax=Planococcus antarcticus DSM 14505 TaxID=1185653 RepID=A0AA87ILU8_9BACL|nr:hypothetical protein [Planococcus antarcticus]EIM07126.1 hypothetical protein A1A1_08139 [Planococcus antarcticus DSM 14505]
MLNKKIAEGTEEFLIEDLLLLAEVYLFIDPKVSLEESEFDHVEEDLVTHYEKIKSDEPLAGYRQLLSERNGCIIYTCWKA